jgi:hypothetical protein
MPITIEEALLVGEYLLAGLAHVPARVASFYRDELIDSEPSIGSGRRHAANPAATNEIAP